MCPQLLHQASSLQASPYTFLQTGRCFVADWRLRCTRSTFSFRAAGGSSVLVVERVADVTWPQVTLIVLCKGSLISKNLFFPRSHHVHDLLSLSRALGFYSGLTLSWKYSIMYMETSIEWPKNGIV